MEEKNNIQSIYEEKFLALEQGVDTDPAMKKDVFNTLKRLQNIAEIIDLFTVKFISSNSTILDSMVNPKKK